MVKVSVLTPLVSYDGENLKAPVKEGDEPKDYLLKDAIIDALNVQVPNDEISGADKLLSYQLSIRVSDKKVGDTLTNFNAEEVVLIKNRAEKALTTIVYGQLCELLDPKA